MSAMMETPVVVIDCQRAGPSTGVPTKTEQGDLWQMLGAAFGDYPRAIAAPLDIGDCFKIIPEIFNIADRYPVPGHCALRSAAVGRPAQRRSRKIWTSPRLSIAANSSPTAHVDCGNERRRRSTNATRSPRAASRRAPFPACPATPTPPRSDEHDEDGVLISDEFTNPTKRRAMMEKRMRKVAGIEAAVPPPVLWGPPGCRCHSDRLGLHQEA